MSIAQNFPNLKPSLMLSFADTRQLDNRVTFTRSTPAVYYDGKTTAMAEQNLLTNSQNFNTGWTLTLSVSSTTATAPDGTSTAYQFSGASTAYFTQTNSGIDGNNPFTYSIYVKAGSVGTVRLAIYRLSDGTNAYVDFNTSAGTIVGSGGPYASTSSITSVGNSWYRCVVSVATMGTGSTGLGVVVYQQSGSSGNFYAWGAQLEQRSSATAYTATTTQAITNYIPVLLTAGGNQPRFDCNPTTGESLGLLIEEQRTNIALYSEQFDNAAWSKVTGIVGAPTILANQVIAPDGTLTGDQVTLPAVSGSSAFSLIDFPFTASAATYTGSFYLKGKNGGEVVWINFTKNGVNYTQTLCTLTTSWQRFSLTSTLTAGSDNFQIGVDLRDSAESAKPAQTFFIWGAQLEIGAFASSYIPTTSASATRTTDAAYMDGANFSSWFNAGEGTLYAETANFVSGGNSKGIANIGNGTSSNSIGLYYSSDLAQATFEMINTGVQASYIVAFNNKVIAAYKFNDTNFGYGGNVGTTDTSCTIPQCTQLVIGNVYAATQGYQANGRIKKLAYYPLRVSNTNLQALTS